MNRRVWILGALLALQPALAQAAVVMTIDGIAGAYTAAPYQGWHEIENFSWNFDRSNTAQPFQLSVTMAQRSASMATIKQAAFSGTTLKKITIDLAHVSAAGSSLVPQTRLTCEAAVIKSIAVTGQNNALPMSQLNFTCIKVYWEEFEFSPAGTLIRSLKGEFPVAPKT